MYSRRWRDATAVVDYLAKNLGPLWDRTRLYHDTLYQSNLPEEFLDAMSSQSVILRGPTCWQSEEGYFGGFEGSYGCCPLNCTHVWNYAQSHARLFPSIGQNMRVSNFITFLHPNGETSHREHAPHNAFIDGHCACIEAALSRISAQPRSQVFGADLARREEGRQLADRGHRSESRRACRTAIRRTPTTRPSPGRTRSSARNISRRWRPAMRMAEVMNDADEREAVAAGARRRHEEPKRKTLERRILHPDSRAQAGPGLRHRLPRRSTSRPMVGAHARPRLSLSGPAREDRTGGGDEAQLPREIRRLQASAAAIHPRRRRRADHLHLAARRAAQSVHPLCRRSVGPASNTPPPAR